MISETLSRLARWLDSDSERRLVAKLATLGLLVLIVGPSVVARAQTFLAQTSTQSPTLTMAQEGSTRTNPVRLKTITNGLPIANVRFVIVSGAETLVQSASQDASLPTEWFFDFKGDPGRTYTVTSTGNVPVTGIEIQSVDSYVFTIASETSGTPPPTNDTTSTSETSGSDATNSSDTSQPLPPEVLPLISVQTPTMPDPSRPLVMLRANVTAAPVILLRFLVTGPDGVTIPFQASSPTSGHWEAAAELERGKTYAIRALAVTTAGKEVASINAENFFVPVETGDAAAEPPPADDDSATPPPSDAAPSVRIDSPPHETTFIGTVPLIARIENGKASIVTFEIHDVFGTAFPVSAARGTSDASWIAAFDGAPGSYQIAVSAFVDGKIIRDEKLRVFKIAAPSSPEPLPTETAEPAVPRTETAPEEPPPVITAPSEPTPAVEPPVETGAEEPASLPDETLKPTVPEDEAPADGSAEASAPTNDECAANGIDPTRCGAWLEAKYQKTDCLAAGAMTRESCAAFMSARGEAADERAVTGLLTEEDLEKVREEMSPLIGKTIEGGRLTEEVSEILPFEIEHEGRVAFVRAAAPEGGRDGVLALVTFDADGDGLTDDFERRMGSDPRAADSDGDGFDDIEEIKNGYDPRGPGKLVRPPMGVEIALLEGKPIEDPRGRSEAVDEAFSVASVESVGTEAAPEKGFVPSLRLTGVAAPNSIVTIFIYTYLPVVITTTTDENGNWSYDFGNRLAEGRHEAYVAVNDSTGKIVAASKPLPFFIRAARAASEEEFLRPDVNVTEEPETQTRWFLIGGLALVLIALALTIMIVRQIRKSSGSSLNDLNA